MADAKAVAAACRQSGRHCGERPALEVFRGRFKGRRTKIILTASQEHFRESRFASTKAILGQCWRTILPLPTTRADPAKKGPGGQRPSNAACRPSRSPLVHERGRPANVLGRLAYRTRYYRGR